MWAYFENNIFSSFQENLRASVVVRSVRTFQQKNNIFKISKKKYCGACKELQERNYFV